MYGLAIEEWQELLSVIHQEIDLLEDAYHGYFPEPSEQLDRMNKLVDIEIEIISKIEYLEGLKNDN